MECVDVEVEDLSGASSYQLGKEGEVIGIAQDFCSSLLGPPPTLLRQPWVCVNCLMRMACLDDESDFLELCKILAEHGEDPIHLFLQKRPASSSSPVSSNHSTSGEAEPKKRKRETAVANELKIPEDDIRRKLPHVFKETFNSCEKDQMHEFVIKHCTENCCSTFRYIGAGNPFMQASYTEVVGAPALIAYWDSVFCAVPDSLFDIIETKYRLLPNKQTSIVCKFFYSGTKVYGLCTDFTDSLVYSAASDDASQDSKDRVMIAQVVSRNPTTTNQGTEKPFHPGTYLTEPMNVAVLGTLVLFTDANHKIFRLEYIFCVKS